MPDMLLVPTELMCPVCGEYLCTGSDRQEIGTICIWHSTIPEVMLEWDAPITFCSNNAKEWRLNLHTGLLTQVMP